MTNELFVDTGAWYALQVPDDAWHAQAAQTLARVVARALPLVTTNLVVGETYSLLVRTHGTTVARRFLQAVAGSPRLIRVFVDEATEREGYELLRRYADHAFSYVDGTSFAVMRRRRTRSAFAFDRHFATAGFVRIPVDEPIA
ncbi:MAG: type II toxin-antitoxin system VapC family toxin [Deltaproteobacteria bacterium]|nr:type II toxin-antitoxin system VapC family toxin [Deltaproteobacteria bacterium]